jgi:hypothetical protein
MKKLMSLLVSRKGGFDGAAFVNLMRQKLGGRERREIQTAFWLTVAPPNVATWVYTHIISTQK